MGGSLVGYTLALIGFRSELKEQTQEVLNGIYKLATVTPGLLFIIVMLIFTFLYPLSKSKVDKNAEILREKRKLSEEKNNFKVEVINTLKEAEKIVINDIPKGSSISFGGSVTIGMTGLLDKVRSEDYNFFERFK